MAQKIRFDIFPADKLWCARRVDGLVCGYFVDQACAVRFARRETCGLGVIVLRGAPAEARLVRAA